MDQQHGTRRRRDTDRIENGPGLSTLTGRLQNRKTDWLANKTIGFITNDLVQWNAVGRVKVGKIDIPPRNPDGTQTESKTVSPLE